jgi:hypothetical protein
MGRTAEAKLWMREHTRAMISSNKPLNLGARLSIVGMSWAFPMGEKSSGGDRSQLESPPFPSAIGRSLLRLYAINRESGDHAASCAARSPALRGAPAGTDR